MQPAIHIYNKHESIHELFILGQFRTCSVSIIEHYKSYQ